MSAKKSSEKRSNEWDLRSTREFRRQAKELGPEARHIIVSKFDIIKENPYRYKRLTLARPLYRIRFSDRKKEKCLIYLVEKGIVTLLCILDRNKEYKNLDGLSDKES